MSDVIEFVGNVPENYDRYMGPVMFEPFARSAAAHVTMRPGMRLLETAAGTGRVTKHLLAKLPEDGALVATDLNEDMLAIARGRLADPRLKMVAMDALDLQFPDNAFDAAICQFGVMFFSDKLAGLKEAYRVLKPRRKFHYSVWGSLAQNPNAQVLQELLDEEIPVDTPTFLDVPFGSSNERDNRNLMADAGFIHVQYESETLPIEAESAETLARGLVIGSPLSAGLLERGLDLEAFAAKVANRFANRFGDRPLQSHMTAMFVSGEKPDPE